MADRDHEYRGYGDDTGRYADRGHYDRDYERLGGSRDRDRDRDDRHRSGRDWGREDHGRTAYGRDRDDWRVERSGGSRDVIAVPYFSFARGSRGSRS